LKLTPVEFRSGDESHLGYYYHAYRKGALSKFDLAFIKAGVDLSPIEFNELFLETMSKRDRVATYFGYNEKKEMVPIGFVGLINPLGIAWFVISEMVWFPWALSRQKLASGLNLINELRNDAVIQSFADVRPPETSLDGVGSKAYYTHLCKYGVMRRVGTMEDFYGPGLPAAVFQSKRRKN